MARAAHLAIAAVCVGVAGCSLLGLDHVAIPTCNDNAQCDVLNTRDHVAADACVRWQCDWQSSQCALGMRDGDRDGDPSPACGGADCDDADPIRATRLSEQCNGVDDDCDLVVDEDLAPASAVSLTTGVGTELAAGFGARADGALGYAYAELGTSGVQTSFGIARGASNLATPGALTYAYQTAEDSLIEGGLDLGCPPGAGSCTAADPSLAFADPSTSRWLLAAINETGCADGQVRIGYFDESDRQVVLRGPTVRSTIATGVDVDPADPRRCTGASRPASEPRGATRTALAALGVAGAGTLPQGLAGWIGRPPTTDACANIVAPVEIIGTWIETGTAGPDPVASVNATGSGVPTRLGTTTGDAAPALAASPEALGYVIGYGNASGDVAIHFVESWGDPPHIDLTMVTDPAYAASVRPTDPLVVHDVLTIPHAGAGGATEVAIAPGMRRGALLELGVTWREGCDMGRGEVWFARVRVDPSGTSASEITPPIRLSSDARAPVVTYAQRPLVAPGFMRDGAVADATTTSGWLVGWIQSGPPVQLVARRLLELDGAPLLGAQAAATGVRTATIYSGASTDSPPPVRYAYLDTATPSATWFGGELVCSAP